MLFKLHEQLQMCGHSLRDFGPMKKHKNFQIEGTYNIDNDLIFFCKIEQELFLICSEEV